MKQNILNGCRILLVIVYTYTLFHKIFDMHSFMDTLQKSTIIKNNQIDIVFYLVPFLELITILALLFWNKIIGFYASLGLTLVFTIYLIALNNFSLYKGCSCGGIFNELSYSQHLIANGVIIAVSIIAIILFDNKKTMKK
ncbi:MAG TPA: MauE/DoxX family redox-associated membrane protein [Flavobacterium sp.]|nr:MauE/DoxX family redox-associated membrane protein [Flavobacterium sp.]